MSGYGMLDFSQSKFYDINFQTPHPRDATFSQINQLLPLLPNT